MTRIRMLASTVVMAAVVAACGQDAATAQSGDRPAAHAETSLGSVDRLPLTPGFYVASDTACAQASNATTVLLRHGGVGGSQDFCAFQSIERIDANSYRIVQACADLRDAGAAETSRITYVLDGQDAFVSTSEFGWTHSARRCEQSQMSADWRDIDISDLSD